MSIESKSELFTAIFNKQRENQYNIGNTTYKQRITKLKNLKKSIEITYRKKIQDALYKDFKKPALETDLTEIYPIISEIKHVVKNLNSWMKNKKVTTPLALIGSKSWIKYEPKGVCLIISPWNFPVNLTISPLISAIAAGNTVILKPSEITKNTSNILAEIINNLFDENEIALIEGEVETSQELLKLPFNHIFFTGSPSIGKIVMKEAAKNLTSVTLELGGKSPTIIDETANLKDAAKKITWGKFMNNGQTCIAPDYILISEKVKDLFITELKNQIELFFTLHPENSNSYCRIVSNKHFNRLRNLLEDASNKGAKVEYGGRLNEKDCYLEPTIISNIAEDSTILDEEIFGPILPVISYKEPIEVTNYINKNHKPLALYIYSKNKQNVNYLLENTRAGSTCINHNVLQYSNHNLPFGGSNNSGIGKSHGYFGFQEFSNMRSVLKQNTKGTIELLFPPYNKTKQKLIDFTIKWF